MRKALWIFSAPVVAGGLAWAVNAANDAGTLLAGAPQAQNGRIMYFSSGGKRAAQPSDTDAAQADESAADSSSADDSPDGDAPSAPTRFVRNRPALGAATAANTPSDSESAAPPATKNYKSLFADADKLKASKLSAARNTVKSASAVAAQAKQSITEECAADEAADADSAREETKLPPVASAAKKSAAAKPAAGKTQQVAATKDKDANGVRHAEMRSGEAAAKRGVRTVQHTPAPEGPPADEDDSDLEAPVAPAKPAKKEIPARKEIEVRTTRSAAAAAKTVPTAAAPAKQHVRKPVVTAPKNNRVTVVTQAAADDARDTPAAGTGTTDSKVITAAVSDDTPMVALKWTKIDEVNVNQECKCGLVVKNSGKMVAKDIVVEAYFPRSVRLIDANPFPNDSKDHLVWIFEHLDPGEEKTVEITMIPSRRGELATSATVRFTGVATSVVTVEEPQIGLTISGAHEVMVGETLVQTIVVSNAGTGIAHDVVVHAKVPDGLEHPRGKVVEMGIGSLGPGESRELRLPLAAVVGCDALLVVEARGSSNLSQSAQTAIKIAAPKLSVDVAGPGLRYIGRHAQYTVTVKNEGVAATDNVRVVHLVPEGFEFIKADKGGKFEPSTGSVSWFVGRLDAGETQQVSCDLNSRATGEFVHHVQATGESGSMAADKTTTRVDGSSKVVMEVADLDDPVEVGTQTAYEIRIRNDGSMASKGIRIACELPEGVELIDTKGPTEHFIDKGVLHFKPLAELGAGAKTTYLIRVNGRVAGNLRLRAKLTSTSTPEPIVVEEITKFYGE